MEDAKQLQEHLERLNPGVKNPELYKLLEGLSTGEVRAGSKLKYRRVDGVKLSLCRDDVADVYGRSRLAVPLRSGLVVPAGCRDAQRRSRNATLEVCLKEAWHAEDRPREAPRVDSVELAPSNRRPRSRGAPSRRFAPATTTALVDAVLERQERQPKRGTAVTQLITLVNEYAFDRVEDASPDLVPLNDVDRDREFWHRVWDQTFDERGLTRVRLSCEYCYVLEGPAHGQRPDADEDEDRRRQGVARREGKLKSGMILSPDALSRLIPRLSSGAKPSPRRSSMRSAPPTSSIASIRPPRPRSTSRAGAARARRSGSIRK